MDLSGEVTALVGAGILLTALYLQAESFVDPVIDGIALQSLLLAGLLAWLAYREGSLDLALLAAITLAVRGLLIPYVLRQQIRSYRWRVSERLAAHRVTGHALAAVAVAIGAWFLFQETLAAAFPQPGAGLAFVLLAEGLLMLATRTNTLVQVVGYLEEENAIVYAGALFAKGFPLFVEVVVFLDVLGVVLVSVILSVQRTVIGSPEETRLEELAG